MSTFVYARSTTSSGSGTDENKGKPSPVGSFVKAVEALVPAEVLALHAAIMSVTTEVLKETGATRISHILTVRWSFFGLLALSMGIYILVRLRTMDPNKPGEKWDWKDWFRMFIPPLAFLAWSMLQRTTAFDAVLMWSTCGGEPTTGAKDWLKNVEAARTVIALFLAVVLAYAAAALDYKKPVQPTLVHRNEQGVDVTIQVTVPPQSQS